MDRRRIVEEPWRSRGDLVWRKTPTNREVLETEFRYDFQKCPREISVGAVFTVLKAIMHVNTVNTVPAEPSRGPFRKSYRNSFCKTSLISKVGLDRWSFLSFTIFCYFSHPFISLSTTKLKKRRKFLFLLQSRHKKTQPFKRRTYGYIRTRDMGIKKRHYIVMSERIFIIKVPLERSCSALNVYVFFILKSVKKRRRDECSKFELGSLPLIDRDRRSRGAKFRHRLLPWQLVVFSTKCKKPSWIDSRKNELRSWSTAKEQLVSVLKTPRHDFASALSCTHGIWDAFSSLFSRSVAQWKDLSNGGFFITIG